MRDVAAVELVTAPSEHRVSNLVRSDGTLVRMPAVSIAVAKRSGANAVVIAGHVVQSLARVEGTLVPTDVVATVTRNYGETAREKADELLFHLGLATVSIVALVWLAIDGGRRSSLRSSSPPRSCSRSSPPG